MRQPCNYGCYSVDYDTLTCLIFSRMIIQGRVASLSFNDSRPSLWDPAIVRAVATEEEKFDETLRWSIQDAIRNILGESGLEDRKSTRLNSSHRCISYAV